MFTGPSNIKRLPVYKSMFSELPEYPRYELQVKFRDPVPQCMNQEWRGCRDQSRQDLLRYQTLYYKPPLPQKDVSDFNLAPVEQYIQPAFVKCFLEGADNAKVRTAATQTVYRDSETQTDPYSPQYILHRGDAIEILTLATLSYGHGLPAGMTEVKMIERLRKKRALEANLPPFSDVSQIEKRRKLLAMMEIEEWSNREKDIERLQKARLDIIKKLLKKQEEQNQNVKIKKLERIWAVKQKELEAKFKKLQVQYIKAIHKLTEQRAHFLDDIPRKRKDHTNGESHSQSYLESSFGAVLDRNSDQFMIRSKHLSTYQGLLELEASIPEFVLNPRIKRPQKKILLQRECRNATSINESYKAVKVNDAEKQSNTARKKMLESLKKLKMVYFVNQHISRPQTPTIPMLDNYPQSVLTQDMFEGKAKVRDLIHEIKSTHNMSCKNEVFFNHVIMQNLQRRRELNEHKESLVNESLENLESKSLGESLDFLSKELVRLQEERRIHAVVMMCERRRRTHEIAEGGRRQREIRRRKEEEEMFKEVIKCHQCCVDAYLESVIATSIDDLSHEQAKQEIEVQADAINNLAYDLDERLDQIEREEIVADLVYSFLIPEARRADLREKVRRSQTRFQLAAHREIYAGKARIYPIFKRGSEFEETKSGKSSIFSKHEHTHGIFTPTPIEGTPEMFTPIPIEETPEIDTSTTLDIKPLIENVRLSPDLRYE